jgi:hypothetical protein
MAGQEGRSQGRAQGRGAAAMGLTGRVPAPELEAVLTGRHAETGQVLLGASGASGRAGAAASGTRPVARHGDPEELLSLPEAAFLIGVDPSHLRRLAENQPQTFFATPTSGDQIDGRVARRLIEWMCGRPLSSPSEAYLLADKDPASGRWRVTRREVERFIADRVVPETVMGFDLVCSTPKSVSLLWAVGDDAIRADIAEAFDAAVNATLAYLEHHACHGMVEGRNRPADGFGVVSFVHDISRADEAHLHTHNLIANAVRVSLLDDDGRPVVDENGNPKVLWRAPDSHALLRNVKTAGYLGAAELRHQLAQRWGVTWAPVRSGVAELAAFPEPLLRAFSTRHDQIVRSSHTWWSPVWSPDRPPRWPRNAPPGHPRRCSPTTRCAPCRRRNWPPSAGHPNVSRAWWRAARSVGSRSTQRMWPIPRTTDRPDRLDRTSDHLHRPRRPSGDRFVGW